MIVRLNDAAVAAFERAGLPPVSPALELVPELRKIIAAGLVRHGGALLFPHSWVVKKKYQLKIDPSHRTGHPDFTGWECELNSFHLDDVVPVRVDVSPDDEPLISEPDQLLMLRQGLKFAHEVVQLARALDAPVRCLVSVARDSGTFRFHRVRPGETWAMADLDTYTFGAPKLIEVDSGPHDLICDHGSPTTVGESIDETRASLSSYGNCRQRRRRRS
ncbi:hypothetical protein [Microlunatus sp. GCM10028923]|uniref:hypothetical protein n=1 Tax=Microlunatus sp. GCM10028923 TaxID=3273400 RepID=UPI00360A5787